MDPNDKTNQTPDNSGADQSAPGMPPSDSGSSPATAPTPADNTGKDMGPPKEKPNMILIIAFVVVLIGGVVFFLMR